MNIRVSASVRRRLASIVQEQSGEARLYRRARMVLLAANGETVTGIADKLGTSRSRVHDWLWRFQELGVEGLRDDPRSGRPETITALERHQVVAVACRSPEEFGVHRTLWTHESLAEALVSSKLARSISRATVQRILDEAEIKPHRVKMWCHSTDPEYQRKIRAIVRLYVRPPKGEPVLCIDEKTGMQALSRSRELQPARAGQSARFEFEYQRHGTRCLFACFNVGTGKILGWCTQKRRREDFFAFMDRVASSYRQRRVHVILDNLNTHRDTNQGDFVSRWNQRHGGRFRFHYTPTHGSWLNQIELWFAIVSRRVLRYGNFPSPDVLVKAIEGFVEEWNQTEARPFRWTYEGLPLVR